MKLVNKKTIGLMLLAVASACILTACKKDADPVYVHVGPNWKALHQMDTSKASIPVKVKIKKNYSEGEQMQLQVNAEGSGKLWIMQVDPNDKVSMLLPNPIMTDNSIDPDKAILLPPANADWHIAAEKPYGESLFVFVVTSSQQSLEQVLAQAGAGKFKESLQLIQQSPKWGIAKHVVIVKAADKK